MSSLMSPNWISVPILDEQGNTTGYRPLRYDQFVLKLMKKQDDYKMLSHAGRGVCTEAGEINDCIKRHLDYEQDINIANLIEELGDMRFYLQAIQNMFGITEDVVLQSNATKLSKRYLNLEYSNRQAELRRDKSNDNPSTSS